MGFPITKTITATDMKKTSMGLNHVVHEDGSQFVTWSQGYEFIDVDGNPVPDLQKYYGVEGEISFEDLQTNHPDIFNALIVIWEFLDSEIRRQEEL